MRVKLPDKWGKQIEKRCRDGNTRLVHRHNLLLENNWYSVNWIDLLVKMWKELQLIVYDFDGVMTDNRVMVSEDGIESVIVSRADGLGVYMIKEMGVPQMILTAETNPVVSLRAKKLGIPVLQGVDDKKTVLLNYCKDNNYDPGGILYVGNDVNDKGVMKAVGYSVATADAHHSIKSLAQMVLDTKGGQGVVRELADKLKEYRRY